MPKAQSGTTRARKTPLSKATKAPQQADTRDEHDEPVAGPSRSMNPERQQDPPFPPFPPFGGQLPEAFSFVQRYIDAVKMSDAEFEDFIAKDIARSKAANEAADRGTSQEPAPSGSTTKVTKKAQSKSKNPVRRGQKQKAAEVSTPDSTIDLTTTPATDHTPVVAEQSDTTQHTYTLRQRSSLTKPRFLDDTDDDDTE